MNEPSALSPEVHRYLELIRCAPTQFETFLMSGDYKIMQEYARDWSGFVVDLPGASAQVYLNVFGQLTFRSERGYLYSIGPRRENEDEQRYAHQLREFIAGLKEWILPGLDSVWCTQVLIQACYDSAEGSRKRAMGEIEKK